jgi:hypothetical protein
MAAKLIGVWVAGLMLAIIYLLELFCYPTAMDDEHLWKMIREEFCSLVRNAKL